MAYKVVIDAGHGYYTAGKRSPDDEREWTFNDKVAKACIAVLKQYKEIEVLRVDDATGKTDVPLITRTNKANNWKADIYVSIHHNASTGKWGSWSGIETYTYLGSQPKSEKLASAVHPKVVEAYGLRNRGIRKANLHVCRETKMPAILVEGGFMDSTIDIKKLRNDAVLTKAGQGIAEGILSYFNIKVTNTITSPVKSPQKQSSGSSEVSTGSTKLAVVKAEKLYTYNSPDWNDKGVIVKKGDAFTIVQEFTVAGAKMYKLKSGKYITANPTHVTVKTK